MLTWQTRWSHLCSDFIQCPKAWCQSRCTYHLEPRKICLLEPSHRDQKQWTFQRPSPHLLTITRRSSGKKIFSSANIYLFNYFFCQRKTFYSAADRYSFCAVWQQQSRAGSLQGQRHARQFCSFLFARERGWHGDQSLPGPVCGEGGAYIPLRVSSPPYAPSICW